MKKRKTWINRREALVIGIIAVLALIFSLLSPTFRTYNTLVSLLDGSYYLVLMAIGVTFPLMTGGVDLSIGTGLVCYALVGGYLNTYLGVPVGASMAVTVLLGVAVGIINGVLVAVMELPPFLATLCTCMVTRGLGSALCGGFGISWPMAIEDAGWFRKIFRCTVITENGGIVIPVGILLILVLVVLMSYVLNHTKPGRYAIAIGSNREAARLAGVNVKLYQIAAYAVCGLFAGLAGVAYAATYPTVYPGSGAGFEMDAIGGAIVGGVSAAGGAGTIFGAFLGVMVVCLMKVGLPYIGLQANWQQIVTGFVLITAVLVDVVRKKRV